MYWKFVYQYCLLSVLKLTCTESDLPHTEYTKCFELQLLFSCFSEFQRLQLEQQLDAAGISQKMMWVAFIHNLFAFILHQYANANWDYFTVPVLKPLCYVTMPLCLSLLMLYMIQYKKKQRTSESQLVSSVVKWAVVSWRKVQNLTPHYLKTL